MEEAQGQVDAQTHEQARASAATPPPAAVQRPPSPAVPASAPAPGLAEGAARQSAQSLAAALQQAGLAAGPQPGQQQRPGDQGAALLAHLQNQARSNMGQMRPQDPTGVLLDGLRPSFYAVNM